MRITRWGEFGILCCMYLARAKPGVAVGAAEIADSQGIPLQYTQQILHRLKKGDIIKSVRGPRGGYALSRSPADTNLKEILYAAEGDTFELVCVNDPVDPDRCSHQFPCGLKPVWLELKSLVDSLLEKKTLELLLRSQADAEIGQVIQIQGRTAQ